MLRTGVVWRQFFGLAVSSVCVFSANCASSQITPDRTLPNNTTVTINGSVFNITGGTQAGRNLFHSFQQFSVPANNTALFNNGLDTQNIFSRVTGGSVSTINGTIQANGTANVFFLNPAGIVFGKNARLNVGGSFVATTANAIQFGNLGSFSASVPDNPALLTVNPTALFYNQIVAGASIQNSSTASAGVAPTGASSSGLRVPDGKSLLLVGGDINMDGGRLEAYGGHVELGGLTSPGTVGLGVDGNNLSLSFPAQNTRGTVSLTNAANINVSAGNGGSITVNASDINITGGSDLIAGIAQGSGTVGAKAGDITLNATEDITIDGNGSDGNGSYIANNVQQQSIGNGGNITLSSHSLELTNGAQLDASTLGEGNAGNVIINVTKSVSFDGRYANTDGSFVLSGIVTTVGGINYSQNNLVKGNGGNIEITTPQLSLTNNAQLEASTLGQGNAGNVVVNAANSVSLDGRAAILSSVGDINDSQNNLVKGNGGNIQITTPQFSLTNGAQLVASTFGQGNSGNVIINVNKSVSLDGRAAIFSSVGALNDSQNNLAIGNGGNIQITTPQLSVTNGAQLVASTYGQGNAGNVIVNAANSVSLDGSGSAIFSTLGDVSYSQNNLVIGKGGNIEITTPQLSVTNNAQLVANTFGGGNAGSVIINAANSVSLDGQAAILSTVGDANYSQNNLVKGNGGNIEITTPQLSVTNNAQLVANTFGGGNAGNVIINAPSDVSLDGYKTIIFSGVGALNDSQNNLAIGKGGNIQITTPQLSLTNGAQLDVSTFGQGGAGNVIINAPNGVSLDGNTTGFFSTAGDSGLSPQQNSIAKGEGGNINITTDKLSLTNGAGLNASTFGQSNAGNFEINAGSIRLDNGAITSQTNSGNGGNINITAQNYILLRNNSLISTTAGTAQAGGNGGNISINTPFVIALRGENSDITANAFSGSGGRVSINATNLFNIAPLSRLDLERLLGTNDPTKLDPQQLPTNDITAISQQNADLSGTVQIRTPDIDPGRTLVTLPTVNENSPKLVSSNCRAFNEYAGGNNFTITGRGGLPPSPYEPLTSDAIWSDTRLPLTTAHQNQPNKHAAKIKPKPIEIVPATGWVFNGKGEVTLISSVSNTTASTPTSCAAR